MSNLNGLDVANACRSIEDHFNAFTSMVAFKIWTICKNKQLKGFEYQATPLHLQIVTTLPQVIFKGGRNIFIFSADYQENMN